MNRKEERILHMLGQVDDRYVLEADPLNPSTGNRKRSARKKWGIMAACLCLIISGFLSGQHFYKIYSTETSYVSVDVNPSLELCLNRFNRVIDVCAYNDDGQKVADTLDIENKSCTEAMEILLENDTFSTYLGENADLTITIVSNQAEKIKAAVEQCPEYQKNDGTIYYADEKTHHEAHENGCSVGKYAAYEELAQYDENITIDDCKDMTMYEIHERIHACEKGQTHHSEEHHGE